MLSHNSLSSIGSLHMLFPLLLFLPCRSMMPGLFFLQSFSSTSISYSALSVFLHPAKLVHVMPDYIFDPPHYWSSICPGTSHFHLYRMRHLFSFSHPQHFISMFGIMPSTVKRRFMATSLVRAPLQNVHPCSVPNYFLQCKELFCSVPWVTLIVRLHCAQFDLFVGVPLRGLLCSNRRATRLLDLS